MKDTNNYLDITDNGPGVIRLTPFRNIWLRQKPALT